MAKNLKFKIKNTQLAEALQLDKFKGAKSKAASKSPDAEKKKDGPKATIAKRRDNSPPPEAVEEIQKPTAPEKEAVVEAPPAAESKTTTPEAPKAEVKKPGPVDDFRKPKIIRGKAPPQAKPPATRKDGKVDPSKKPSTDKAAAKTTSTTDSKTPPKPGAFKDYREVRSERKPSQTRSFDTRDRMGLRDTSDDRWRRRRNHKKMSGQNEALTIRPKELNVRIPISVKDLASEMKLKASQLISKLFMQGMVVTINDILDDETTIQLLGHEFGCEIQIDTTEEERIKITDKTIREEIGEADPKKLILRAPIITFMGHVDHGKTSLIDAIRKSDITSTETGAITQHIGAFCCHTAVGDITILDTPGHEAFSAMRERGAEITDLIVLVIAGDEGMRDQTIEAMNKAKDANVPILVAINKSDKPDFDPENIYRQLSEHELLPEAWGGTTITVNCSATTGEGVQSLLEMLALQAEILELKADPSARARGSVIESAMHKGMGSVATVLVQNGTLKLGDCLVFDLSYARVKTMQDEHGKDLKEAGPSTPVEMTGLSNLPEAGSEFIAVSTEKEAREIAEVRQLEHRHKMHRKGRKGLDGFLESKADDIKKKVLHVLLRADVQGSLEALKHSLEKIHSDKAELNVVSAEVGQISESDVELAGASGALVVGFHTKVESHAEALIKQKKVNVKLHNIIYHAVDDVKEEMRKLLDKVAQENEMGQAEVKAVFKSSHLGRIAGCQVSEGMIKRTHKARLKRAGEVIWKGSVASLKKGKEDVKEVTKGHECGILLQGFNDFEEKDIIEAFEVSYLEQEL